MMRTSESDHLAAQLPTKTGNAVASRDGTMNWHKSVKRCLLGAVAASGLAAPGLGADPGLTDSEITIGLFGPLSGPLVGYGLDPLNAAKMWYDDINKKGGIHGRKIKL